MELSVYIYRERERVAKCGCFSITNFFAIYTNLFFLILNLNLTVLRCLTAIIITLTSVEKLHDIVLS